MNLKRAVEPHKAHTAQKNQKLMLVKYFTYLVGVFSLSTSCFFSVFFVPYVAICRFGMKGPWGLDSLAALAVSSATVRGESIMYGETDGR
jgi:hypothetical protein